ncbi:MAG UNVERIFIED_CONTAM: hypothetical protein LVT10_23235 [Anaerolineae bacterium]
MVWWSIGMLIHLALVGQRRHPLATLAGRTDSIWGVHVLADGRFLSCGVEDEHLALVGQRRHPLATLAGHNDSSQWRGGAGGRSLPLVESGHRPCACGTTTALPSPPSRDIRVRSRACTCWRTVASSRGVGTQTLRLWDKDGTPLATLAGHTHQVRGVEVLADGRFLSRSVDKTLRLWDKDGTPSPPSRGIRIRSGACTCWRTVASSRGVRTRPCACGTKTALPSPPSRGIRIRSGRARAGGRSLPLVE